MATYRSPDLVSEENFKDDYYDKYFNGTSINESDFDEIYSEQDFMNNPEHYDTGQVEDLSQMLVFPNVPNPNENLYQMYPDLSNKTSSLNNQHYTKYVVLEEINNSIITRAVASNYSSGASLKAPKRRINLSPKARYLKDNYYLIFTNKKKFPKTLVKKIHEIIQKPLNLKPFSRSITRFHDLYFVENANDAEKILTYLVNNKIQIIEQIPELKEYQRKQTNK